MDYFGTFLQSAALGLDTALLPINLFYCFLGVLVGTLVGVLPGIGTMAALSLLFPLTFHLPATTALIMLSGIWYGTLYGGSAASVLLNVPGSPSAVVVCIEGYPMARQGRGGVALFMSAMASFFGATTGIVMTMLFAPYFVRYGLSFSAAEYFSLMLLGLVAASTIGTGSALKSFAMVVVGLIFGTVGMDMFTGQTRLTFGILPLQDGIGLVALAMGVFGVSEVISSIRTVRGVTVDRKSVRLRAMIPTRDDVRRCLMPIVRGTGIGSFFGILPGTGPTVASFMAYAVERKVSREPQRFGRGAIEGIAAPESANNAADQTAFIPTMTLGIPGSATMAIMLGAMMIQGIAPGPLMMSSHPDLFWGLIMSFWIGNILLLLLNIPMIGIWVRLLTIPYHLLYPAILMFICIGVYSINNDSFDVWEVLVLGVVGYAMRLADLPSAPLLLGFVLGPLVEENFRRALIMARGNLGTFIERPISGTIMAITLLLIVWSVWRALRPKRPTETPVTDSA